MAKSNSKGKRGHENDESSTEPTSKNQRSNSPRSAQPKEIPNENLDRLSLRSLFNVAVSNESLRPAARIVYKRKCVNQIIEIDPFDVRGKEYKKKINPFDVREKEYKKIRMEFEKVSINDFKTCLQFLQCFGPVLTNVRIDYGRSNSKRFDYIHRYINKYCADSLLEIYFRDKENGVLINHFEKPFPNVQKVTVEDCHLGDQFPLFSQWFPNVRNLTLVDIVKDSRWLDSPFLHLEHVSVDVNNGWTLKNFTKAEISRLLDSCNQLNSLEIHMPRKRQGMTMNTLLNIIEGKPAMENLLLVMEYCTVVKFNEIQRLINEHPQLVELDVENFVFTADNALNLIRQLNSLQLFYFQLNDPLEYESLSSRLNDDHHHQWEPYLYTDKNRTYVELQRKW